MSLYDEKQLKLAAVACIGTASKYHEVIPYERREKVVQEIESQLFFTVFKGDISQTSPMTFINLIMGAWPEDDLTMIERLAGITSMMCLLDQDFLQFRTSVLAVACLETVLDRLSLSQTFVPNFTVDSEKTI